MSAPLCDLRDDFLDRALTDESQAAFVAHLTACPICRQAVAEQQHFDDLLRRAVAERESVPEDLAPRVRRFLPQRSRRQLPLRIAAFAAAVLLCLGIQWVSAPRSDPPRPEERVASPAPPPAPAPDPRSLVRVDFGPRAPVIALLKETKSPNVTVIWVYAASADAGVRDPAPERNKP